MNYSEQEFYTLMEAVEAAGGEHLDRQCTARTYDFTGKHSKQVTIGGCGNSAFFKVPYLSLDGTSMATSAVPPVEVCAVDDDMGRWPRFGGDRFGKKGVKA
jgi:hypothetical protein